MQILFVTHYFPPEGNAPATRVFALCRRWAQKGHQVTVLTGVPNVPNGKVYSGYHNRWWQTEDMAGIQVVRVWSYLAPNQGILRRIANYLSFMATAIAGGCFLPKPDIILATSPQFFCGWAGALLSRIRQCPFILEIRDLWPESIEAVGALRAPMLLRFLGRLAQRLYAQADQVVAVGVGYRDHLERRGVPPAKLSIIMNGFDREYLQPERTGTGVRHCYGLDGNLVCSYLGTVGLASGLEVVLRAAAKLKAEGCSDIKFMIVGDGALLGELKKSAAARHLDNVVFTGLQPKHRIPDFLAASDVCLVHLKKQALFETVMPSKIFEALAMARPIILGVPGYAAEFIGKSGGGICIEPESEDELILAIKLLRRDPNLGASLGRAGRDYVLANFDRDSQAERYLEIIETVAGSQRAAARTALSPARRS